MINLKVKITQIHITTYFVLHAFYEYEFVY